MQKTYTNPVWNFDFPDPHVIRHKGVFYAYGTETGKYGSGFQVLSSPDLVRWTHRGLAFTPPWSRVHLWAPEVAERGGTFYMTYSALNPKTNKRDIGVATSKTPTGPFVHRAILVEAGDNKLGVIDTHVAVEPDGTAFLFYSEEDPRRIVVRKLAPDWLSTVGDRIVLISPDQPWEQGVTEAPTILRRDGVYHMFYSANGFETSKRNSGYCVAHAYAPKLLGPYKKTGAILAQSPGRVYGPGHQCVVTIGGTDWMIYHGWNDDNEPRYGSNLTGRTLRIDRLTWRDGMPQPIAPTTTSQPL